MMNKTLAFVFAVAYGLMWAFAASADPVPKAPVLCLQGKPCEAPAAAPSVPAPPPAALDNTAAVSAGAVKWHPGHYEWVAAWFINDPKTMSDVKSFVDEIANDPNVQGLGFFVWWGMLEGPTTGDYSIGFAWLDDLLSYMRTHGNKKLVVMARPTSYGYVPNPLPPVLPAYLVETSRGGTCGTGCPYGTGPYSTDGISAKVWEAATMDRWIALTRAYGARYDNNPNLEVWGYTPESDLEQFGAGYTQQAYDAQLIRLSDVERAAFPHTNLWHLSNWANGSQIADFRTVVEHYASIGIGLGAHDVIPHEGSSADQIYVGAGGQFGTTDHRMQTPYMALLDQPDLCDEKDSKPNADAAHNYTAADFFNYLMVTGNADLNNRAQLVTHMLWPRHTGWACPGIVNQTWDGGPGSFKSFVDEGTHPTRTTCPTTYSSCNRN